MADELMTEAQALAWLKGCAERAGGPGKLAKRAGVSKALVSQMLHGKPITGKVAQMIGLQRVYLYEFTKVVSSPEQERYENQRREWAEQNPHVSKEIIDARDAAIKAKEKAKKPEPQPELAVEEAVSVFEVEAARKT